MRIYDATDTYTLWKLNICTSFDTVSYELSSSVVARTAGVYGVPAVQYDIVPPVIRYTALRAIISYIEGYQRPQECPRDRKYLMPRVPYVFYGAGAAILTPGAAR